jgi:hypothetical protein
MQRHYNYFAIFLVSQDEFEVFAKSKVFKTLIESINDTCYEFFG